MSKRVLPDRIEDIAALEDLLATPSAALVGDMARLEGDILILGVAGKMGPSMAALARRAAPGKRIIGVARFSEPALRAQIEATGVETIACDLLDPAAVAALPHVPNVILMAGRKFGAAGDQPLTWAMNTHVPAIVAQEFRDSRIVAFSTGNIYPMMDVMHGGATERTAPQAGGEYAQSCLGRERILEYFSRLHGTPGRLFRLNYAIETRYGVLDDIARKVHAGTPVDLRTGHVNVIWQGDANAQALRLLLHCTVPTTPINITGPETLSVRWLAEEFGRRLGRQPVFSGAEAPTAWLSNTTQASALLGYPEVPLGPMMDWVADWVARGGSTHNKPTKFEVRDGAF
jgi:hypothetical protein